LLDVDRVGIHDHDLVHARVGEEPLERAEPQRLVCELADERVVVDRRGDPIGEASDDAPESVQHLRA